MNFYLIFKEDCHIYQYLINHKIYPIYLADCELISYNGQGQVYHIKDNGLDILHLISKEKERLLADSEDITMIDFKMDIYR